MAVIKQSDFIDSIADALQYISYYHPVDYITNLAAAYGVAVRRGYPTHGAFPGWRAVAVAWGAGC